MVSAANEGAASKVLSSTSASRITPASSKATNLNQDPHFQPFLKIFTSPHTQTNPIVASGDADQLLFHSFIENWEAGKVSNLQSGLANVDKQIDAQHHALDDAEHALDQQLHDANCH